MGFYPKHLKQRRHRHSMRLIAHAALAGCMFVKQLVGAGGRTPNVVWTVQYPDGQQSFVRSRKRDAAALYMRWFNEYQLGLKGRR